MVLSGADNNPVVKAVHGVEVTRVMECIKGMLAMPADSTEITRSGL
jgi:hypothetical protein